MKNKTCIVTGASSGLGKAVARLLAREGSQIIMISRDNERGRHSFDETSGMNPGRVEWIPTDLSSLDAVRKTAQIINKRYDRINILFNCAGVILMKRMETVDGLETMFATNYLGHFLLTNLLYPGLLAGAPSKVITVSGRGHKSRLTEGLQPGTIDFDDLQGREKFSFARAAKQAVLAKIIFTYELARRWQDKGIEVSTVCPGLTKTNLTGHLPWFARAYMALRFRLQATQTPEEGAGHLIRIARMHNTGGKYYEGGKGYPREARSSGASYDLSTAKKLWAISEQLAGQVFNP